jgi:hydrogenase maturation protein HypF
VSARPGPGDAPPASPAAPAALADRPPRPELDARRFRVAGVVQGVGLRPFVHRLATRHALTGWVRNDGGEVHIHVEGERAALTDFAAALRTEAPPLARLDALDAHDATWQGYTAFAIVESAHTPQERLPVAPDVVTCDACLAELFDPADRRHRYPFITCTDCGPRYTVIEALPYDRARTSLAPFPQCRRCLAEYTAPGDRRFHSESNACPDCGPRCWAARVVDGAAVELPGDMIAIAAGWLREGGVLALRGLGGFHLACDATTEAAVATLRARKHREAKPLAVMVRTLADAQALAHVSADEAALLTARERPIVLLVRRPGDGLAPGVAPGLARVGVMLAYSPVHHLLLEAVGRPLVMTSGNLSDEPIAAGNAEAVDRLAALADGFLLHDREIVARIDDSVARVAAGAPLLMRRARGVAPLPLALPAPLATPVLAVGAHLKHTFALGVGRTAYLSPHIGDLESLETLEHFRAVRARYERLFGVVPAGVVHDAHPGYLSTQEAQATGLPVVTVVQHHHAHLAAVLGEYGVEGGAIGVTYDGTGAGDDGTVWGGELLVGDAASVVRAAHLVPAPLPGGDVAVRRPWRVAMGYGALDDTLAAHVAARIAAIPEGERRIVAQQLRARVNAPLASSMGRLFDAAAAVCGVRLVQHYEGQAAMELEALAGGAVGEALPFPVVARDGRWQLDPVPLLVALAERAAQGVEPAALAASFHRTVVDATVALVARLAEAYGTRVVALSGGCFQNARLVEGCVAGLSAIGCRVLVPRQLPPNDGAIAYGQLVVAAARAGRG